jgi:hypothetical protein
MRVGQLEEVVGHLLDRIKELEQALQREGSIAFGARGGAA